MWKLDEPGKPTRNCARRAEIKPAFMDIVHTQNVVIWNMM
jgi:hypothetical protein